jgi:hypothetical protein
MPHVKRRERYFLVLTIAAIFVLTAALIVLMTRPAWPATLEPQQYTCEDVRRLVAQKGKVAAIAFAIEQGLSIRQIWQIRRTCKV